MDRLNERNRILVEARMLPASAMLTDEQIRQIVDHFKEYIVAHDIKPRQVAREVNYSAPVLSDWMALKYKGDVNRVTRAINNWIERDARRRASLRPQDYVKTWVAESIRSYICLADRQGSMAVIVAPSGTGKTLVLTTIAEEMRALYVCCSDQMNVRSLYLKIARMLGWVNKCARRSELEQFIVDHLDGTGRMILIDEAHQLGPSIRALRTIHDQAQVPIVFCGTDAIERAADDREHGRGQFASRCIYFNATEQVRNVRDPDREARDRDLYTVEEVRAFFARSKIRFDRCGFKLMWALACLPGSGGIRLLERVVKLLNECTDSETFTRNDVVEALRMIDVARFRPLIRFADNHAERSEHRKSITAAAG